MQCTNKTKKNCSAALLHKTNDIWSHLWNRRKTELLKLGNGGNIAKRLTTPASDQKS